MVIFCWSCHSWTQSAPWFTQYSCLLHPVKDHACRPTVQSWQCRWKTGNHLCWGQPLPWTRCRSLYASGVKFSSNLSPEMDLPPVPLQWQSHHPGTKILKLFYESRKLYTKSYLPSAQSMKISAVFGTLSTKAQRRWGPRACHCRQCQRTGWAWLWLKAPGGAALQGCTCKFC